MVSLCLRLGKVGTGKDDPSSRNCRGPETCEITIELEMLQRMNGFCAELLIQSIQGGWDVPSLAIENDLANKNFPDRRKYRRLTDSLEKIKKLILTYQTICSSISDDPVICNYSYSLVIFQDCCLVI